MQPYSAIVLGSTGNVGRQIVNLLAASSAARQVVVVNRRQTEEFRGNLKVREVVVPDMDKLAESVESAAREAGATIAFCAIGVGKGSQKMPVAEVRKIEVQYPEAFAKGCKAGGVQKVVTGVGIPTLSIYKPSVILGNSNTPSYLRYVFPAVQFVLPSRYHSIHKNELARAMFEGTQKALVELQQKLSEGGAHLTSEVKFYEYTDMKPLFNKGNKESG
jgi:NAD(P)-dependent dehydrogenase (short-subunit alcohol dehydrogenase family)